MQKPSESSEAGAGARFFDGHKRDLGWATSVSKRPPSLGRLTVLDVTTSETTLATSLVTLDKARLFIRSGDGLDDTYAFAWASGYANGHQIRIQGVLDPERR